jgi:hypothetical protein
MRKPNMKMKKIYALDADYLISSVESSGIEISDDLRSSLESLRKIEGYTVADSVKDAYNMFCNQASLAPWDKPAVKKLMNEFYGCVRETSREAEPYQSEITSIAARMARDEMNKLPGESLIEARKRIRNYLKEKVYTTKGGNLRKNKIVHDFIRTKVKESEPTLF